MSRREEFVDEVARASAAYESYLADVEQVEARIRQQVQEHLAESREAALSAIRDLAEAGGTKYQLTKVLKTRNWNKVLKWWDEAMGTVPTNAPVPVEPVRLAFAPVGWAFTHYEHDGHPALKVARDDVTDPVDVRAVRLNGDLVWFDPDGEELVWAELLALPDAVVDWATENI